jgi:hypothetical protein
LRGIRANTPAQKHSRYHHHACCQCRLRAGWYLHNSVRHATHCLLSKAVHWGVDSSASSSCAVTSVLNTPLPRPTEARAHALFTVRRHHRGYARWCRPSALPAYTQRRPHPEPLLPPCKAVLFPPLSLAQATPVREQPLHMHMPLRLPHDPVCPVRLHIRHWARNNPSARRATTGQVSTQAPRQATTG